MAGRGDDVILAGHGRDEIEGGLGNDFIDGGSESDFLAGLSNKLTTSEKVISLIQTQDWLRSMMFILKMTMVQVRNGMDGDKTNPDYFEVQSKTRPGKGGQVGNKG